MKETQEKTGDERVKWLGAGPWLEEPDRIEWEHAGLPCLMERNSFSGHWCGYVGVALGHPWYGKDEDELGAVEAHGGVTYSRLGLASAPEGWWVGFDCAHAYDFMPMLPRILDPAGYKSRAYVQAEVERLADQAIGAADRL